MLYRLLPKEPKIKSMIKTKEKIINVSQAQKEREFPELYHGLVRVHIGEPCRKDEGQLNVSINKKHWIACSCSFAI